MRNGVSLLLLLQRWEAEFLHKNTAYVLTNSSSAFSGTVQETRLELYLTAIDSWIPCCSQASSISSVTGDLSLSPIPLRSVYIILMSQ